MKKPLVVKKLKRSLNLEKNQVFCLALLFFIGLVKVIWLSNFGLKMLTDDNQNFTGAMRLLQGGTIYSDYQAFFPPVADYFLAFLLKSNGFSIVNSRYIYAVITAFLFPLLYLVTKRLAKSPVAFLVAFGFIFSETRIDLLFFHTFFVGTLFFAIRYLETHQLKFLFVSGFFVTLGSFFRIDFAMVTAFSVLVILVLSHFSQKSVHSLTKMTATFIFIPTVVNLGVFLWLVNQSLFLGVLNHLRVGIQAKYEYRLNVISFSRLFPQQVSLKSAYIAFTGWLYLFWGSLLIFWLYDLFKAMSFRKIATRQMITTGILAHFLLMSIFYLRSQYDLAHFVKGGIFFFPILASIIANSSSWIRRKLALLSFTAFLGLQLAYSFWFINFHNTKIKFQRGGAMYVNGEYIQGTTLPSAQMIKNAVAFLQQSQPNEKVFVAPYMSMLYFVSERNNPTIYDNLLKGYLFHPFGENYVIKSLEKNQVRFVVYDEENGPFREGGRRLKDYYPLIDRYLMENFKVESQIGGWLLMKRKGAGQ